MKPNREGLFESVDVKEGELLEVSLGNGTMYRVILNMIGGYLWVSVIGKGCYGFAGFAYWGYVNDKLNLGNECDAKHLADFINDQLGLLEKRQGTYYAPKLNHFEPAESFN
jgi:hypothetical protein